jgi:hypothetical protein
LYGRAIKIRGEAFPGSSRKEIPRKKTKLGVFIVIQIGSCSPFQAKRVIQLIIKETRKKFVLGYERILMYPINVHPDVYEELEFAENGTQKNLLLQVMNYLTKLIMQYMRFRIHQKLG